MSNRNYIRGRNFEYKRMKAWRDADYAVSRTSGSHGKFDLYALKSNCPVEAIQCKVVKTEAAARRLLASFVKHPPMTPSSYFHQHLEIWVTDTRQLHTTIV